MKIKSLIPQNLTRRAVIFTGILIWELNHSESFVRLLAVADFLEIEPIILITGYSLTEIKDDLFSTKGD